jgi:hypothetical protein
LATYSFILNDEQVSVDCPGEFRLLWVLRDLLSAHFTDRSIGHGDPPRFTWMRRVYAGPEFKRSGSAISALTRALCG